MTRRVNLRAFAIGAWLPFRSGVALLVASCGASSLAVNRGTAGPEGPEGGAPDAGTSGSPDAGTTGSADTGTIGNDASAGNDAAETSVPATCANWFGSTSATSEWVHVDADGGLAYETTPQGNRIMNSRRRATWAAASRSPRCPRRRP